MNITNIKSPNFSNGRNKYVPIAIVIHIMNGTLDGTDSWFQNPDTKQSAHFGIGKNGDVHQYVDQENTAWHAGRVNAPTWKMIKVSNDPNKPAYINPNFYTIGIEHEGDEHSVWTDAMYQTSSEVIASVVKKWNIPLDRDHVIGHHEIYSLKTCPGTKVDLDKLIQMAIAITNPDQLLNPEMGI
jgi:N-acetyl-anhydromuramyl-L-alanine amidase AmpD